MFEELVDSIVSIRAGTHGSSGWENDSGKDDGGNVYSSHCRRP